MKSLVVLDEYAPFTQEMWDRLGARVEPQLPEPTPGHEPMATTSLAARALSMLVASGARMPARFRGSRYRPHQSHRECARRVGGAAWAAFKQSDRARRGLPPKE